MKLRDQNCTFAPPALTPVALTALLVQLPDWRVEDSAAGNGIVRDFDFKNYYETIAFVNALAWMAHHQDHHPELVVGYRHCRVVFTTHSAGHAVSRNDVVCAAKVDAIYEERTRA